MMKMKYTKVLPLAVLILVSCTARVTFTSSRTPTPEPTPTGDKFPTATVTRDPAKGDIEGRLAWFESSTSTSMPINKVNLEINGHTGSYPRYTARADQNGHFKFSNIEPGDYGFGIYLNLQLHERLCDAPQYIYGTDLKWLHYATWLKGEIWHDILFSSVDVTVDPGETVVLDFVLKCP
jgi:hypothetical protein